MSFCVCCALSVSALLVLCCEVLGRGTPACQPQAQHTVRGGNGSLKENSVPFSFCVLENWVRIACAGEESMARGFSKFFFGKIAAAGRAGQRCQHLACGVVKSHRLHHATFSGQENGARFRTWALNLVLAARSRAAPAHACGASRRPPDSLRRAAPPSWCI